MTKNNLLIFKLITMKKLTGMKKNFASLENKQLENLKSIQGGNGSASVNITSNVDVGPDCGEVDTYSDTVDANGNRRYLGRLIVCNPE